PAAISSVVVNQDRAVPVASAAPSSDSASTGSGKRGIAYNDATVCSAFSGKSQVSWAFNWEAQPKGTIPSGFEYVPTLHDTTSVFTSVWDQDVKAALASGSKHLMGVNEPDYSGGANLSPEGAAAAHKTYLQKYGSQAKLGSPSVTNGGAPMGLDYLGKFLMACSDCQIDFVQIHWYNDASLVDDFKNHIQQAYKLSNKPIWLTEFGATGSDAAVDAFLREVLPWLDSQSYVERYAYFYAASGKLISGSGLSSYGSTYAT
ncbi:hypothetical protein EJ06DRAFT_462760, partial [Trichodelitschia bisporula]